MKKSTKDKTLRVKCIDEFTNSTEFIVFIHYLYLNLLYRNMY